MSITIKIFIGRFQPFHRGHKHVITRLKKECRPVIVVGSSEKINTFKNPLSFNERRKIINNCFPGIDVFPVPDKDKDKEWVRCIERKLSFEKIVSGNEWTKSCFEEEGYEVEEPDFLNREKFRGTVIRDLASREEEGWKKLVPHCSRQLLEQFNFQKRMMSIDEDGD